MYKKETKRSLTCSFYFFILVSQIFFSKSLKTYLKTLQCFIEKLFNYLPSWKSAAFLRGQNKEHNPTIAIIQLISSCRPTDCGQQHRGPIGNCSLPFSVHSVHLWLSVPFWVQPPAEVFGRLCNCWLCQWGERGVLEYRGVVDSFVRWCEPNHLHLNTTKTKELVVDFRRRKSALTPISINGETGSGPGLQIPWSTPRQQTELAQEHGSCVQEGSEPAIFPEEAPVFRRVFYQSVYQFIQWLFLQITCLYILFFIEAANLHTAHIVFSYLCVFMLALFYFILF